jgi:aspartate carbamoyltransferase catalytic subunit
MKHILSATQFKPADLQKLFDRADKLRAKVESPIARQELADRFKGEVLVSLFYEPSTRTRLSFEIAAGRFGMAIASTENAREFSSAAKGETIEDTIKVLNQYQPAIIVMRHHETGAAARAAAVSEIPIINAGDGKGEHPTQALLDLYTIQRRQGRLENLTVVIGGDLAHGRTARSLVKMLALYKGNTLRFVSTPELAIGKDIKDYLAAHETKFTESDDNLPKVLAGTDVVYWTRLQKERLEDPSVTSSYIIDNEAANVLPQHAVILHPLPRIDEIDPEVDSNPRAAYFEQAGNGMFMRMALIEEILTK